MKPSFDYITYGSKATAMEVEFLLEALLRKSLREGADHAPTPLCIWGRHGIGKTELVRDLAKKLGARFTYIAPAQFEEMGDLLGMPRVAGEVTKFVPPEWVPREEGPGILLIDDVNRADDRILRGLMQLLQHYELASWGMPPRWHIILTANPDGGDYSVTPLDDAMITRMLHVTMEWDLQSWARWAERSGIDPRGIAFVLSYPELVNGRRTTPRSLVQFFREINHIVELDKALPLVKMLGEAALEPETAAAFIGFLRQEAPHLLSPQEILGGKTMEEIEQRLRSQIEGTALRIDLLKVLASRLIHHLLERKEGFSPLELDQLKHFLLLELIPNDLRLWMAQELIKGDRPALKELMSEPEIGRLILSGGGLA